MYLTVNLILMMMQLGPTLYIAFCGFPL